MIFGKKKVKCYEFHTIMCQTNEKFISILNIMHKNTQIEDDMMYLNKNCVRPAPIDPAFPYLFCKNKYVALNKKKMLAIFLGQEIVINVVDQEEENHDNFPSHLDTTTLPLEIIMKLNILVEIYTGNYDSQDVIINGADGIIKYYTKTDDIDFIWIQIFDMNIGHRQARKLASLYSEGISKDWIPIL